ncbi:MAG: exopolysaccharide biosynthesis WecB/TagA/CpsF family protein [Sulfurimonas sp.]|jgi:exopolysaccharide biosynthesis WecB/TagA/CpsF family protein|uniref:WecB/TagA/CpsF family glycosyltransferase n=1 Tax=Sulfurimonas sp. TaxID=2022749 RepID=UPI0039E361BB
MQTLYKYIQSNLFPLTKKVFLPRINIMGVSFINATMQGAIRGIKAKVKNKEKTNIYFINADTLNKTYSIPSLESILGKASCVFPDGSGVKMGCKMMRTPLKENLNGTDMFPFICQMAEEEKLKVFFYGAKDGVALKMKEKLLKDFPSLEIVGVANGYDLHDNEVINMINHSKADIVFVAKGAPLQEEWIHTHSYRIAAPIVIGVGGLFDFYSGNVSRAPLWMRKAGIEWVYRFMLEPQRMFYRYIIGNPLFLMRMYLWNKKQKTKRLKKYYELKNIKEVNSYLPTMSFMTYSLYPLLKRILDVVSVFIAMLFLSPLMLGVVILIKLESKGAAFFHHKRVGRNGKVFNMYKFRSMVENAEVLKESLMGMNESKDGVIFKIKSDPRITKVGKFIRKWSIDELPQLFNVLRGDMSLVGPRPPLPSEVEGYTSDDLKRLHVAPGITCYWQISGRSEIPFKQQVDLDKKYISTCSLWTDIKILFATVPAVLAGKGAY